MSLGLVGCEEMKNEYANDPHFSSTYANLSSQNHTYMHPFEDYLQLDGFLFKESLLCIPSGSRREKLVRDAFKWVGWTFRKRLDFWVGE